MASHYFGSLDPGFNVFRLCTETPRAGGRVLEEGDKKLLALAHELGSSSLQTRTSGTFANRLSTVH